MNSFEGNLVYKLKEGDTESFTALFEQYNKKIYNYAFKMCGNGEDADDIVQRTFIQTFTNISDFKQASGLYTWLYAITKNLCFRLLEKRKKSTFSMLDKLVNTVQSPENPDNMTKAEKQYYINQVKEGCLLGLLRCLSFYQRTAFILNVLLDVKPKDIAVIIDKSETATRLLIYRSKQNIKNFLCKNCSLYDPDNHCHCENLINFSLKQGWIQEIPDRKSLVQSQAIALEIENVINDLKKITVLYNSLEDHQPSENIIHLIRAEITKPTYKIFSQQKVK